MSLLLWIGMFFGFQPQSQDTVLLTPVEVYAPTLDRFTQGQKIKSYSKAELNTYQGRSLGDLLQETSPVFIRQYGAGMLASPSFRGTSAGHTSVFWNGIPVNSPSLGQSDLSILPVAAVDQVAIHFGNGGALFGNEAIGGSIHLGTKLSFSEGFQGSFSQQFGSFGQTNSYLKSSFSSEKLSSETRFYRESATNDFHFKDLGQAETPIVRAQNSAVKQMGIVQDLAWNLSKTTQLKASFWYNQADREIQPVMGSNTNDIQSDQSFRMAVDYFHFGKKSILNLKSGLVQDNQLFNQSENNTVQYFLSGDWDSAFTPKWNLKTGLRLNFIQGELSTYQATDQRVESYQSLRFQPDENLKISLNLRQLAYLDQFEPFIPSLGADWDFWKNSNNQLSLKASIAKGIKVPTLNDRFWEPGGNPDLIPEKSQSGEIGLIWQKTGGISWENSLTYYRMTVDNWIIWIPKGNFWTPENIREVQNQGIEYQGQASTELGNWNITANWAYTWSRAISTKGIGETDPAIGKQLPYTPEHQANGRINAGYNGFSTFIGTYFIGERRVTSDGQRTMPSYQFFNLGVSYGNLSLGKIKIPLRFQVNNLFNKDYQVLYLRPMPGRSYQFTLSIQL
ncbi:TonB-dependent receptor [Algoriphagus marinus]|uniref:TonB-dependent receptor n=1 Tax=Algoriphagus marinus TaxID=1925762 RepID=UPI00094B9735|nr:TonB-dependent receptor [Algoriphagus marinus]